MALNIKNAAVVALVRKLAARRGTDMTQAIRTAVEHELEADEKVVEQRLRAIRKIQDRVAAMPRRDTRSGKEIRDEINAEIFRVIVDTSAIVAIVLQEPGHEMYALEIAKARTSRIASPAYLECSIVLGTSGNVSPNDLDEFLEESAIEVVDFSARHAKLARRAYLRYGRGYHEARLNFGDCMSYALAIDLGEPLLYKGDDFSKTDVISALLPR